MKKVTLFLILLCLATSALAQQVPITGQNYVGADLGLTSSAYFGNKNFVWAISDVQTRTFGSYMPFDDLGSGLGFVLGGKVAFALSPSVDLSAKIRYLTNHTSRDEDHVVYTAFDLAGDPSDSANSTGSYGLTLSNLSLAGLANVRVSDQLYGIGGLEFSSLLSNSLYLSHTLKDGKTYYSSVTGTSTGISTLTHDYASEPAFFTSSRLALQLGLGTAVPLGSGSSTLLDAELLFSIPFTGWMADSGKQILDATTKTYGLPSITYPTLWYASLTVGIRFPFGMGGAEASSQSASTASTNTGRAGETKAEVDAEGKVPLTGRVTDNNGKSVDANITVVDLTSNEVVATDKTGSDGRYSVRVKAPGKYSVTADADGYLFGTAYFEVDKDGRILSSHPDIKLSETTNGRTRLLVFFDFNSSELKPSSYPELNRAVKLMKAVPTMQVEIAGYTDSVGSVEFNKALSERRANAVKDYLVKNGIAKKRIGAKGYGEESPIADNSTDEGRAENRRVEFVVLSK
jgi:outer membrane protein OmpA-like peptidoglycan-associated protein